MMTITMDELRECVYKINPSAKFSVWQDSPTSGPYIRWENGHTGESPTVAECEAVLDAVRADIAKENRVTLLTMRQARLQMLAMGVLSQVEAAVSQAGDAAQIEWEYAMTVERDYPLFLAIKGMLGFTDEQEETFFNEGSLL
jgi:hypothetical protein